MAGFSTSQTRTTSGATSGLDRCPHIDSANAPDGFPHPTASFTPPGVWPLAIARTVRARHPSRRRPLLPRGRNRNRTNVQSGTAQSTHRCPRRRTGCLLAVMSEVVFHACDLTHSRAPCDDSSPRSSQPPTVSGPRVLLTWAEGGSEHSRDAGHGGVSRGSQKWSPKRCSGARRSGTDHCRWAAGEG